MLVGGIPRSLGNCTELQALLLSSNNLDDIIPPEIGHLKNLRALDVSRNSLSGPVPAELGGCVQLSVLVCPFVMRCLVVRILPIMVSPMTSTTSKEGFRML